MDVGILNPWQSPAAYIVRHGETELNASNCYRGWENPQLNEAGLEAARQIAQFFSYESIGRIVSSDLDRALQTAEYILSSGTVRCPYVSPDYNLRPWGIARFAGKEKTEENQKRLERYIKNPDLKIPDGESLNDFRARSTVMFEYISMPYEGLPTVIVTHTSNLCFLDTELNPDKGAAPEVDDLVEPGGIVAVYLDTDGNMKMIARMGAVEAEAVPEAS